MVPSANPASATAELEEARKQLFLEGTALAAAKHRMEAAQHEYNSAYGFTSAADGPSQRGEVRSHDRVVTDVLGDKLPIYDTPAANMGSSEVAHEEMDTMEGEEREWQEKHVRDVLAAANEQQGHLDPNHAFSESFRFNDEVP